MLRLAHHCRLLYQIHSVLGECFTYMLSEPLPQLPCFSFGILHYDLRIDKGVNASYNYFHRTFDKLSSS